MSQFVWIDYGPAHPHVGPWIGEWNGDGYVCRTHKQGKWDFEATAPCDRYSLWDCEAQFTVHYVDEDHPLFGEICVRMMRAALTKGQDQ